MRGSNGLGARSKCGALENPNVADEIVHQEGKSSREFLMRGLWLVFSGQKMMMKTPG